MPITIDMGRVIPTNEGTYSPNTTYEALSIVSYSGSSYISKIACRGVTPGSDDAVWQLMARRGDEAIFIAAACATGTKRQSSTTGTSTDGSAIYYYEDEGILGYSTDGGLTYWTGWGNMEAYGTIDAGECVPFEGRFYVCLSTGRLLIGTSADILPIDGGGLSLSEAQQAALDSGITAQDVAALRRVAAMNIRFSASTDSLTLTDGQTTKTYNLASGGSSVTRTYANPVITALAYDTPIAASGGTASPTSVMVTQAWTGSDGSSGSDTYNTLTELPAGAAVFSLSAATGFSLASAATGAVSAASHSGASQRQATVSLTVSLNGLASSARTATVTQAAASSVTRTYAAPSVTLDYPSAIPAAGGTSAPSLTVTQAWTGSDGSSGTDSYNSLAELRAAGGTAQFRVADSGDEADGWSVDSSSGVFSKGANTDASPYTSSADVTVTLNGKSATVESSNVTQAAASATPLFISAVRYTTANDGMGNFTATPILTASDGLDYSVEAYGLTSHEAYSLSCGLTYGASFDTSSGVITYNRAYMLSELAAGDFIASLLIDVSQQNDYVRQDDTVVSGTHEPVDTIIYNCFDYEVTQLPCLAGVRGAASGTGDGGKLYKGQTGINAGIACMTIQNVAADDVFFMRTSAASPLYVHVWETSLSLVIANSSTGAPTLANSSKWTTNAETNYSTFVSGTTPQGHAVRAYIPSSQCFIIYRAIGAVPRLTFTVFRSDGTDSISYAKIP